MASFNKVVLVGNVVRDPELRFSPSNLAVARTAIAVNRKYKDKEEAMFIDLVLFGKTAETLNSYATKGTPILVEGRLSLNRWEDDEGKTRSKHEIIVENFQLLGGGKRDSSESFSTGGSDSFKMSSRMEDDDEDIPF